jgi:predicted RNase H-like nuclease
MTKKQRAALRRFRRVHEFLTTHQVDATSVKLQVLQDVVRRMSEGNQEADASTRLTLGETARQKALRDALWDKHMVPISRIARHVFGVPGMDVKFQLPKKRSDNDTILGAAQGMVQAAEPQETVFVQQEGLPADFLPQFRAAIAALAASLPARVEVQRRKQTSRKTLEQLRKDGVAAVDVLDAIVKPRLAAQPELLGAWNTVKRPIEPGGGVGALAVEPDITPVKAA